MKGAGQIRPRNVEADHYAVLGLTRLSDAAAIQVAYRRCALQVHPDKPGGSEAAFHAVALAFEILSAPHERVAYNERTAGDGGPTPRRQRTRTVGGGGSSDGGCAARHAAAGPSVASPPATPRDRALMRLEANISTLPRERRRGVFAGLPPRVSEALLAWMQRQQGAPAADSGAQELVASPRGQSVSAVENASGSSGSEGGSEDEGEVASATVGGELVVYSPAHNDGMRSGRPRLGSSCHGIHKAGGASGLYQASVFCCNMAVASRPVETLEKAIAFKTALVLLRSSLASLCGARSTSSPSTVEGPLVSKARAAIAAACRVAGIEEKDLGLSFRPVVSAVAEVGRYIHGLVSEDVGVALQQRAELLTSKTAGWAALRVAWIQVLRKSMEEIEAAAMVDSAWKSHAPHRARVEARRLRRDEDGYSGGLPQRREANRHESPEEAAAREFAAAVQGVERAVGVEDRKAAVDSKAATRAKAKEEREEGQRAAARRRWAADSRRTTEEILAGPPPELR